MTYGSYSGGCHGGTKASTVRTINLANDEYILGISGRTENYYLYLRQVSRKLFYINNQNPFYFSKISVSDNSNSLLCGNNLYFFKTVSSVQGCTILTR